MSSNFYSTSGLQAGRAFMAPEATTNMRIHYTAKYTLKWRLFSKKSLFFLQWCKITGGLKPNGLFHPGNKEYLCENIFPDRDRTPVQRECRKFTFQCGESSHLCFAKVTWPNFIFNHLGNGWEGSDHCRSHSACSWVTLAVPLVNYSVEKEFGIWFGFFSSGWGTCVHALKYQKQGLITKKNKWKWK